MARVFKNDKRVMNVIFKRNDFTLCKVPVPKGYLQSQTHCGIACKDEKYYMTTSPYPSYQRPRWYCYLAAAIRKLSFKKVILIKNGEDYENPMIYEGIKFTDNNIPFEFKLVKGSPLMQKPEDIYGLGSFCSDPDISIIDEKICVLNRTTVRGDLHKGLRGETTVHLITGDIERSEFRLDRIDPLFHEGYKSPCLIQIGEKYYYFCLDTNSYNTGEPCKNLLLRESTDMIQWSEAQNVCLDKGAYEPWHISIFKYRGKLYAIIACVKRGEGHRCWQMLGVFDETLTKLKIFQTPLTDYRSYRGSAMVRDDGEFILYSTTVYEKIEGGKSVDGREVIMAHMPFKELINSLNIGE